MQILEEKKGRQLRKWAGGGWRRFHGRRWQRCRPQLNGVPNTTSIEHYQCFTLPVLHTTSVEHYHTTGAAHRHRQQQLLLVLTDSLLSRFQLFCLELCFYFAAFSLVSHSSSRSAASLSTTGRNITFWILSTISSALCFPSPCNSPGIPRLGTIKKFTYVLLVPHLPLLFAFHRLINNPSVALPSSTAGTPAAPPKTGSFGNLL